MSVNVIETRTTKGTLGELVSRFILKPLAVWRARQVAMNELLALDDHMLSDIGISRAQALFEIDRELLRLRR